MNYNRKFRGIKIWNVFRGLKLKVQIFKRVKKIFYPRIISETHLLNFLEEFGVYYIFYLSAVHLASQIESSIVDTVLDDKMLKDI
jgi:hypothetical protein